MKATSRPYKLLCRQRIGHGTEKEKRGGVMCARVVEQDVQLRLLGEELGRRLAHGREAREVELEEDGLLARRLLELRDHLLRLLPVARGEVRLRIVGEQSLGRAEARLELLFSVVDGTA